MVLRREELIGKLQHEVRILRHLISAVDSGRLDRRATLKPTLKQRSLRELLGYFTVFVWIALVWINLVWIHLVPVRPIPIQLRTIHRGVWG